MSLQTDLSSRLDTTALVTNLLSGLSSVSGDMNNVTVPANVDQLSDTQARAAAVDTSGLDPVVGQIIAGLRPLLQSLPAASELLSPLTTSLDLIEGGLISVDLPRQLENLSTRLGDVLKGPRDEGFIGILVRFAEILAAAPEQNEFSKLLDSLFEIAGGNRPTCSIPFSDIGPALRSGVLTLGGLMSLETTLAEAEQLTTLMAVQLDAAEVNARREALVACITGQAVPLPQFISSIDVGNPIEVQSAASAIASCSQRLTDLTDFVSRGSAFGEATLLYLDLPRLQESVNRSAGLVRNADLGPLERTLRSIQSCVAPVLTVDLSGTPTFTLESLLTLIEGRVSEIAAGISAFDFSQITDPLTAGLATVIAIPRKLDAAISEIVINIQSALGRLRDAVAALPIQSIGNAIRQMLQPLTQALEVIGGLVDTIKAALGVAVEALKDGLNAAEGVVDDFKQDVEALFKAAATFIDGLKLDQVLVNVAENIKALTALIEKAQMKPYFDTAVDAIDGTTGVIENVPFSLLPDSMEQEVADAIRPVKTVDLENLKGEIESLLQIGPDGKFELRPDIEAAVADIQEKYDALIEELKRLDPNLVVQRIDVELKKFAEKVAAISPQVELQPVQEAIERLRNTMAAFDLNASLKPLRDAFDSLLEEAERYSPAQLISPLETRLDTARDELIEVTRLRDANQYLELLTTYATELMAILDPAQLKPQIERAMQETVGLLDEFPQFQFGGGFGTLITSLLTGMGLHVNPLAFEKVLEWLQGTPGTAFLTTRSRQLAESIAVTRAAVAAFDPAELATVLAPHVQALTAALARLPAGPERTSLQEELGRLDLNSALGNLANNRARYLERLADAEAVAQNLSRTGLSEVDVKIVQLSNSFAPLAPLRNLLAEILSHLGITGLDQGLGEVLRRLLAVATPKRLADILAPVYDALRSRILDLVNAVINPIKQGISDLLATIDKLDLTPLREAVDTVFQDAIQQIRSLHPDALLADVVTAFEQAKAKALSFNPLADIETVLAELRDTTTRVLGKLSAAEIMATPVQIYKTLMGLFEQLDLNALLQPLFDLLDTIARQVHDGLTETVDSFSRLQDALPDTVGSTSVSAGAQASVG